MPGSLKIHWVSPSRRGAWEIYWNCWFYALQAALGTALFGVAVAGIIYSLFTRSPSAGDLFGAFVLIVFCGGLAVVFGWLVYDCLRGEKMQLAKEWFKRYPR